MKIYIWDEPVKLAFGSSKLVVVAGDLDEAIVLAVEKLKGDAPPGYDEDGLAKDIEMMSEAELDDYIAGRIHMTPELLGQPTLIMDVPGAVFHWHSQ